MDNAYKDLMAYLNKGENITAIVFGEWGGWDHQIACKEEYTRPVPVDMLNKRMTLAKAKPYLNKDWSFYGGYGGADCHSIYAWTNKRIIWVSEYDGATSLDSAPLKPCDCKPDMG